MSNMNLYMAVILILFGVVYLKKKGSQISCHGSDMFFHFIGVNWFILLTYLVEDYSFLYAVVNLIVIVLFIFGTHAYFTGKEYCWGAKFGILKKVKK